jgi:hypothetical protein
MKDMIARVMLIVALLAGTAGAQDQNEIKKINFLIESVEKLQGAKFIRNGSEHGGKEAAEHLKMKLQKAGDRVKTADDFIRLCASKSYLSGKPYQIRYDNGKTINSEQYFREQLLLYKQVGK